MYYTFKNLKQFINQFNVEEIKVIKETKYNKQLEENETIEYYNIPCTFDIETTSCYKNLKDNIIERADTIAYRKEKQGLNFDEKNYIKLSFMYIWMLSINDVIIIGRTWDEFHITVNEIVKKFKLNNNKRLIWYVHNLSYEFQFIRKHYNWINVFATEERKVIYAICENGIEYKCSYFLSNLSLETIGKNLIKYKAEKKVGDLDYNIIRTSKTPLTEKEIGYCLYDVIVLSNYIKECMEFEANSTITDIVLTNTGRVRKYCKQHCLSEENYTEYKKIIKQMTLDKETYLHLKASFSGGFTHANAINSMITFKDVFSVDFTSSYPAVLLLHKYPMGKGIRCVVRNKEFFYEQLKRYACLFEITFHNIKIKSELNDCIISESKCFNLKNAINNNGRVVSADKLSLVINEIDYKCIEQFYEWDSIQIGWFKKYKKDYLPKALLECILKFYGDKTVLKDVIGEESNYQNKKGMLNSTYGMMATDIVRSVIKYDCNNWSKESGSIEDSLNQYNKSKNRFLSYEWGCWCTSYARMNLYSGMLELKSDFIYADTDSNKFTNYENHKDYFNWYNEKYIPSLIDKVCKRYNFDKELFSPKTIKGKTKTIGVWDLECKYDYFRTLGAKRYMVQYNKNDEHYDEKLNGYQMTISGVNKKTAMPYLVEEAKKKNCTPFDLFDNELFFSGECSGKLLHTYIDHEIHEVITDCNGVKCEINEKSSVHLEPSSYSLSITDEYINLVRNIQHRASK